MQEFDWHGLYSEGWSDDIVPDAYSHPAKYARGLIRQIYRHALECGYLQAGDRVVDPFGGVALGSLDAARYGLNWTGVELEEKFVTLGNANIDLWRGRYAPHFPGWGTARLLKGDSRQLCRVVGEAGAAGCISSPPFETVITGGNNGAIDTSAKFIATRKNAGPLNKDYGDHPANIGNNQGETFWSAAALIVAQVHQILRPGGVAIWVCKNFVRNKKIVPFSDQWQALCEAHGFVPVERIRAWVVEDHGVQAGMFGDDKMLRKERKSFFRRLAEKNGSPRIDWEDVLVMRKGVSL